MNKHRLIDANELYKLIEENSYTLVDRINSKDKGMFLVGIKEAIDKSPTAYDIDKVVEQLEALADEAEENWKFHASLDSNHARSFAALYNKAVSCYTKAIEIVKGGAE